MARSSDPAEQSAGRDLAAQSGARATESSTAGKLAVTETPDNCVNISDQQSGETASREMHNQTPLQLPADTIALSGHIGNYQSAVSLKFQQVNEIKIKAINTAKNSPLGNDDQSVVEDKPFDKTGMSMGDTDQSKLESLATDKAEPSKGEADQSMVEDPPEEQSRVEHLLDVGDATDQSKVENLPRDEATRSRDDTNQHKPRDHESVAQSYNECCEVLGCCRNITSKQHAESVFWSHSF